MPEKQDTLTDPEMETVTGELCPFCSTNNLTLVQSRIEVPFFGPCYVFSMDCSNCKYHKADVESEEVHPASKYTMEIGSQDDLKVRVVKSAQATVKIPRIAEVTPGPASNGYVTNAEGIINRIKKEIESKRDSDDDPEVKKKAKNLLKKLNKVLWGSEKIKLIIEDPTGNSAIISDKAVKAKL